MRSSRILSLVVSAAALMGLGAGCSSSGSEDDASSQDSDLSSITARTRTLKFGGVVFVEPGSDDQTILYAVRKQTQSAFGALRTANIGTNSRELKDVDVRSFVKTDVKIVDPGAPAASGRPMMRVSYTFTDAALVPKAMATRSAVSLATLGSNYQMQSERILRECTENGPHDREFQGSIWYVFNPSLQSCKTAMTDEQKKIDTDRAALTDQRTQVPKSEFERLYVPATFALSNLKQNTGKSYPEYDRLYGKDKLVIGMVNGMMADWAAGEHHDTIDDEGYGMWFEGLREVFKSRPMKFATIEPAEDISTIRIGTKTVTGLTFESIMQMELDGTGFPANVEYADRRALRVAIGNKLAKHWVTFEAPVSVKIGSQPEKNVTIQLNTYFGAESDSTPHKRALKSSDVFIYNGHSYIGYGPLDPSRFRQGDFTDGYQLFFVNGCVSYNYYEKDYFPLKRNGSKDLDIVTNGLESWVGGSGPAMGRFVGTLVNGNQASYTDLLKAAQFEYRAYSWGADALRVVDGEIDNQYTPARAPIVVKAR